MTLLLHKKFSSRFGCVALIWVAMLLIPNLGATPVYQWKKNNINAGANSPTYTDAAPTNGDLITLEMTSSDPYANPVTATSNGIPMTVVCAPSFTACPIAPVTANTATGLCNATVTYTVAANGTPAPTLTYDFTGATTGSGSGTGSGATFNKGNTTVTVTATNDCGTTTCVFTVTVTDNQMPTISCPSIPPVFTSAYGASTFIGIFNGKAYFDIATGVGNFLNLNAEAVAAGGYITTIETMAEQNFLAGKQTMGLISGLAGIGLYGPKPYLDNDWIGPATSFRAFHPSEPTGASGYVGLYSSYSGLWIDHNTMNSLIVEIPATGSPFARNTDATECNYTVQGTEFDPTAFGDNCPGVTISNDFNNSATLANADLPKGSTTITWTVTDGMGMSSTTCAIVVTVSDNQMPTITCPSGSPIARNTDVTDCNYTVQGTEFDPTAFGDNCPGATISNSFNNSNTLAGADLPKGSTTITWTVTDGMGMSSTTCAIMVTVSDNQMPTITCPSGSPIARNTDATECNYTVQGTEFDPTAFGDNCPGATIANDFNNSTTLAGADLPKGSTTITWTVTDDIAMSSTTCAIVVTVSDNQMPTITCPSGSPFDRNTTECNYTVQGTEFDPTAFGDNCPGATISNSFNNSNTLAGADLPKGSTTITWTVTDGMGMSSTTCAIMVTVSDNQMPTITCPSGSPFDRNTDPTECDYTVQGTEFDPTAFGDNCPGATITNSFNNSSTLANADLPKGPTMITWTVTDGMAMSSTTCAIVVTVSDNQMPTITCPSGSPFNRNTTECNYYTVQGTEFNPSAFGDNCPGSTITNDFNNMATLAGAKLSIGSTTITWTVTDGMGMSSTTCAIVVTVSNTGPFTVTCPASAPVISTNPNCQGTIQDYTALAIVSGTGCATSTVVQTPPQGTIVNPGTVVIKLTVTDSNSGETANCVFNVTVSGGCGN